MTDRANCAHLVRSDGRCPACGDCNHEVILNAACFYCGATELPPRIEAPAAGRDLVPLSRLKTRGDPTT